VTTWTVIRASGVGAYLMLFASVAWGLAATTAPLGRLVSKASASTLHAAMSTVALILLGLHLVSLFGDTFRPFSIAELTIPMVSEYRPVAVTLGIAAMDATLVVVVTSWFRHRLGTARWRRTHLLATPAFALALLHGVFAGTDSAEPWMYWTYVTTGLIVVFLVVVRALTVGFRPERAARPERPARPERVEPASPTSAPVAGTAVER
jgi:sulfoxide reductase heme-binding subunit YedZ